MKAQNGQLLSNIVYLFNIMSVARFIELARTFHRKLFF